MAGVLTILVLAVRGRRWNYRLVGVLPSILAGVPSWCLGGLSGPLYSSSGEEQMMDSVPVHLAGLLNLSWGVLGLLPSGCIL